MSDSDLKVTDKRMFTPEGELREGYRHLDKSDAPTTESAESAAQGEESAAESAGAPERQPEPTAATEPEERAATAAPEEPEPRSHRVEIPSMPGPGGATPAFFDLMAALAQPAALYLGEMSLPDGSTAEDLELARLHIDLLDVLREKTRGNLDAQELAVLDDTLYQLRMRYVQKRR